MTEAAQPAPYTLRNIEEMLGFKRGVVLRLVEAGFVKPTRGARNEYRFSFHDVVLLRTAHELRQAQIAPRKVLRALRQLRHQLPASLPMAGLRIRAVGNEVAVRQGGAQWAAQSGQRLLDFDIAAGPGGQVAFIGSNEPPAPPSAPAATAQQAYERALTLEAHDPAGAEAAYRRAIALDPGLADAHANLGALLCEAQRCADALAVYDGAIAAIPEAALLHFNRGVALELLGRPTEALASYLRCLVADPDFSDAHYNAGLLFDARDERQSALRHFSAYRRATRSRPR